MANRAQSFDHRQSMQRKDFEVFHYKESNPDTVNIHHHDFYEIYFFLGGDVSYWVEGKTFKLDRGDLLLINPMELHHPITQPSSPYERVVLWIDRNYLASLCTPELDLTACFRTGNQNQINLLHPTVLERRRFEELFDLLNQEAYGSELGSSFYAQSLLFQLMIVVNRMAQSGSMPVPILEPPNLVSQITSYINRHYSEEISLDTLAKEFYVSKYYLSHEFSKQIGTSIYRYITLKRLTVAKELIADGKLAGEVYIHCGFHNYPTFYRAFKSEYGISPGRFAEQIRG